MPAAGRGKNSFSLRDLWKEKGKEVNLRFKRYICFGGMSSTERKREN